MQNPDITSTAVVVATESDKEAPLVRSILRKAGFQIVGEGRVPGSQQQAVSLAVVDADGADPARIVADLHDRYPAARVLLLSEEGETRLQQIPGYGHVRSALRKPFKRSQLLGAVLNLMEQPKALTA